LALPPEPEFDQLRLDARRKALEQLDAWRQKAAEGKPAEAAVQ
jgi:hypothetical protein